MEGGGSKHLFFLGDFVDVEPGGGAVARTFNLIERPPPSDFGGVGIFYFLGATIVVDCVLCFVRVRFWI